MLFNNIQYYTSQHTILFMQYCTKLYYTSLYAAHYAHTTVYYTIVYYHG